MQTKAIFCVCEREREYIWMVIFCFKMLNVWYSDILPILFIKRTEILIPLKLAAQIVLLAKRFAQKIKLFIP